ncbi:hypothetical protein BJ165DRAFT_757254 [Panaeolus papilionaceus]|nr:hypothetical protein BJ165DRAFT_757254 [Panaeolus papilionaceus]
MTRQTSLLVSLIPLGFRQDHIFNVLPLAGASHHRFITNTTCAIHSEFHPHPPSPTSNNPLGLPLLILLVNLPLRFHYKLPLPSSYQVSSPLLSPLCSQEAPNHLSPAWLPSPPCSNPMIEYSPAATPFNLFTPRCRGRESLDVNGRKRKWKVLV